MLTYFLLGAAIGAGTGVPVGPVNVAVIEAAYRHCLRRAIAVGFGGAFADCLYAMLGILGVGPILERNPEIPPILHGISGILLVVYGIITARSQPVRAVPPDGAVAAPSDGQHVLAGFTLGVALIIMNPAALLTWVVIVGSRMAGVTTGEGIAATLGVGVGSFLWFTLVAYLADHGKKVLGDKTLWISRVVGVLLVGFGVFSLARAGWYFFAESG